MTVIVKNIIPAKTVENTQVTQYTATNADAPVNGYITFKDSGGTVRKIATIA